MDFEDAGPWQGSDSRREIRIAAMDLLARREHSRQELKQKLCARHHDEQTVITVLEELNHEGLQDDGRYAEAFVRSRADKGQGPVRIQAELRERGIEGWLIEEVLDPRDPVWRERMESVRRKRFGDEAPATWPERARQMRFLQYRGFGADMVRRMLDNTQE